MVNNYPEAGQVHFVMLAYRTFDTMGKPPRKHWKMKPSAINWQYQLKTGYQALDEIHLNLSRPALTRAIPAFSVTMRPVPALAAGLVLGKLFVIPSLRHTQVKNELPALGDLDITLANIAMSRALGKR